jgi:ATP-dependent helicase/nuclease subunit B
VVHEALGLLTQRYPRELPANLAAELKAIAKEVLAGYASNPRVAAFWGPRLNRFADWFAETEGTRRSFISEVVAETKGQLVLEAPAGPFTLTVRADRIDVGERGLIVTDYKSGQSLVDLKSRAAAGRAPQLPLEAAIAAAGGFTGVPAAPVMALRYISTAGGEPPGHEVVLDGDPTAMAQKVARLIAEFDRQATPYRALRRAKFKYDYDPYTHLARVAEWSDEDEEED